MNKIFGFEFGADVTLDMREHISDGTTTASSRRQVIDFKCVDSQFFSEFDGSWIVEEYNTEDDDCSSSTTSTSTSEPITIVRYIVDVRPKGVVPVAALEWRIKEDVPVNIVAVAKAATAAMERHQQELLSEQQGRSSTPITDVPSQGPRSYQRLQKDPSSSTRRSPRRRQSLFQQPLQRLTNQAANNLKQTAKSILPKPVISTAKQAINIINNNNNNRRRIEAPLPTVSRLQTTGTASSELKTDFTGSSSSSGSSNDMEVDWYDDETMAMYL